MAAAHVLESADQAGAIDAEFLEDLAGGPRVVAHGQQEMFDGNKIILQAFGFILGLAEQAIESARDPNVVIRGPRDSRQFLEFAMNVHLDSVNGDSGLGKQGGCEATLLIEKSEQQVLDVDLLVIESGRQTLGALQRFLGLFGEAVHVHVGCLLSDCYLREVQPCGGFKICRRFLAGP